MVCYDSRSTVRIVCLSDTHLTQPEVPDGDLLLHAGDATYNGRPDEIERFNAWFAGLPHRRKIFVAGNHDWLFQTEPARARRLLDPSITYLEDSGTTIGDLRVWGSPWQPWFFDWAFNLPRGEKLREKWRLIPDGVDVLITHGPPLGIGDRTVDGREEGCRDLLDEVVGRVRPRLHLFGHIHEGYGRVERDGIVFVNAAVVDERYEMVHPPVVVDLV
jgi:predicted phosphohydrolase